MWSLLSPCRGRSNHDGTDSLRWFPPEVISHAVWHYHRFLLGLRFVEELPANRCIVVTCQTVRQWCQKFGSEYALNLNRWQCLESDVWHLDELFIEIGDESHYLWLAVNRG